MANYDNKLGEWFKQVEEQEQALKARKSGEAPPVQEEPKPVVSDSEATPQIRQLEVESPVREAPASVVATVETVGVVADTSLAGTDDEEQPAESARVERSFAEEAPPVEDFFSFLNRSAEKPVVEEVEERVFELPKEPTRFALSSEGTGEPRPLNPPTPPAPPAPVETPEVEAVAEIEAEMELPLEPEPAKAPEQKVEPVRDAGVQANWDRMPHHLQTLFASPAKEVAQHSYKAFKETREDLIQRLLDPIISLEEAARILNVCPTTVRRYTNRGVLKHFRTAGNQRRFKLSDVLVFMESQGKAVDPEG